MDVVVAVSRFVLACYFLYNGFNHIAHFKALSGLAEAKGIPAPGAMVGLSGLMLIAGGASFLFNYGLEAGAGLLAVFLVAAAVKVHDFWTAEDAGERVNQMSHFMKNLALAAAVLVVGIGGGW